MTINVSEPVLTEPVRYDKYGSPEGRGKVRICKAKVSFNGSITDAVAHCVSVDNQPVEDDAPLKWANFPGHKRTLVRDFPVYLGLFEVHADDKVYLHTVSDTLPEKPVITTPGDHVLRFRIDSADHCTEFSVKVHVGTSVEPTIGG